MQPIEILENLIFIERGYLKGNHFVYRSESPILNDQRQKVEGIPGERVKISIG